MLEFEALKLAKEVVQTEIPIHEYLIIKFSNYPDNNPGLSGKKHHCKIETILRSICFHH